jgi:predicted alpha/beta hydrolase
MSNPAPSDAPRELDVRAGDGHHARLRLHGPAEAEHALFFIPALGVSARQYDRFGAALAGHGIASVVHEWRGMGSSDRRASRRSDWGYRELLGEDLPAALEAARTALPGRTWHLGGHSLGGQFAALQLARQPAAGSGLVLVATGVPHPPHFPWPMRGLLPPAFALVSAAAALVGHLPGRALRFAGREARGVIRDWVRSGRSGRYEVPALGEDLEAALGRLGQPALGLLFEADPLGPPASMRALLGKLGPGRRELERLDAAALGARADHFAWMRRPDVPAARIAAFMAGPGAGGAAGPGPGDAAPAGA